MAAVIKTAKFVAALTSIDPKLEMWLRVCNNSSLVVGPDPDNPTHMIDFAREKVISLPPEKPAESPSTPLIRDAGVGADRPSFNPESLYPGLPKHGRLTRPCSFELKGNQIPASSLRLLLMRALYCIEFDFPGTLGKLSKVKNNTKRIVSQDRKDLFEKQSLSDKYAAELGNGFYVGINNSQEEVISWLKKAAEIAGLTWGVDFKLSLDKPITELTEDDIKDDDE
jgi:hypothetical protein